MRTSVALQVVNCDWGSRQPVGDERSIGRVPVAIQQAVPKRRAHGCCSPGMPADPNLGKVTFVAPHTRGGDCFGRDREDLMVTTVEQLRF